MPVGRTETPLKSPNVVKVEQLTEETIQGDLNGIKRNRLRYGGSSGEVERERIYIYASNTSITAMGNIYCPNMKIYSVTPSLLHALTPRQPMRIYIYL